MNPLMLAARRWLERITAEIYFGAHFEPSSFEDMRGAGEFEAEEFV